MVGYRAWRNVKKDLREATRQRDKAERRAAEHFASTGRVSSALTTKMETAAAEFWKIDREARRYRAYWPGGKLPAKN